MTSRLVTWSGMLTADGEALAAYLDATGATIPSAQWQPDHRRSALFRRADPRRPSGILGAVPARKSPF